VSCTPHAEVVARASSAVAARLDRHLATAQASGALSTFNTGSSARHSPSWITS